MLGLVLNRAAAVLVIDLRYRHTVTIEIPNRRREVTRRRARFINLPGRTSDCSQAIVDEHEHIFTEHEHELLIDCMTSPSFQEGPEDKSGEVGLLARQLDLRFYLGEEMSFPHRSYLAEGACRLAKIVKLVLNQPLISTKSRGTRVFAFWDWH